MTAKIRTLVTVPRGGGARCDLVPYVDIYIWNSVPKGVTSVDATMTEPGPLEPIGCPLHGVGCPEWCPVLRAEAERP